MSCRPNSSPSRVSQRFTKQPVVVAMSLAVCLLVAASCTSTDEPAGLEIVADQPETETAQDLEPADEGELASGQTLACGGLEGELFVLDETTGGWTFTDDATGTSGWPMPQALSEIEMLVAMYECVAVDDVPASADPADEPEIEPPVEAVLEEMSLNERDFNVNGFSVAIEPDPSRLSCSDRLSAEGEVLLQGEPGAQLRFDREPLTRLRAAFVRVTFADETTYAEGLFPSAIELEQILVGADSRVRSYLDHVSYGQFELEGSFIADVKIGLGAEIDGRTRELTDLGVIDLDIPNFDESDYDVVSLIVLSDFGLGGSRAGGPYSEDGFELLVNGERLESLCKLQVTFAHVGHQFRDVQYPFVNTFEAFVKNVELPGTETWPIETASPLSGFEETFLHELIHVLGISTHAMSSTNGIRTHNALEVEGNQTFLWEDYGNKYDIMGSSEWSQGLNSEYRSRLGWIGDDRAVLVDEAVEGLSVTLNPIDLAEGPVMVEVRLPFAYALDDSFLAAIERSENQGYVLEVWPAENPYYWSNNVGILGGTNGLIVYVTDGYSSAILDASPSPNIDYSWGTYYDLGDVALRPGNTFDDGILRIDNVELLDDGRVSFNLTLVEA